MCHANPLDGPHAVGADTSVETTHDVPTTGETPAADENSTAPSIDLFQPEDVAKKLSAVDHSVKDRDEAKVLVELLRLMQCEGHRRRLVRLPRDWEQQLQRVADHFPNFDPLVEHLAGMCALASRGQGVLRMDPVLLAGPPGIGKTVVVEAIAKIVAGGFERFAMAAAQTSSLLTGSEEHWSNSKPGRLFHSLVKGRFANPLFLLDEVDKASEGERWSPLSGLYDLLEPATARRFTDLAVQGIPLDASAVLWFATANALTPIPEPILSRLHVIEIRRPTADQCLAVARSIDAQLRRELPAVADMSLSEDALDKLSGQAPRAIRKLLLAAYGKAAHAKRSVVMRNDINDQQPSRRAIGFV